MGRALPTKTIALCKTSLCRVSILQNCLYTFTIAVRILCNIFRSGSGCCSQAGSDCLKDYSQSHAYDLHRACSGKSNCEIQAAGNLNCYGNPEWSTYGKISFFCTRGKNLRKHIGCICYIVHKQVQ